MSHPLWDLWQHIQKEAPEYTALLGLLAVAVIANMPRPEVVTAWLDMPAAWYVKFKAVLGIGYRWVYDSLQAFMAARHPQASQVHSLTETTTPDSSTKQETTSTSVVPPATPIPVSVTTQPEGTLSVPPKEQE